MKKECRKSPANLVAVTAESPPRRNWFEALPEEDQEYVLAVAKELRKQNAPLYPVADQLKAELSIKRGRRAIAETLRKLQYA